MKPVSLAHVQYYLEGVQYFHLPWDEGVLSAHWQNYSQRLRVLPKAEQEKIAATLEALLTAAEEKLRRAAAASREAKPTSGLELFQNARVGTQRSHAKSDALGKEAI